MRVEIFTLISGTVACNAKCPYCISRMTPKQGLTLQEPKVNWRNFRKSCQFAKMKGVTNVIITGKGEPTLCPEQISKFLEEMERFRFPIIELQTNGIMLERNFEKYEKYLLDWYRKGLDVISISIAHYNPEKNREIFTTEEEYIDLESLIKKLHEIGFSVRLSCVLIRGYIDNVDAVMELISAAKRWKVEQLTLRHLCKPERTEDVVVFHWTNKHILNDKELEKIRIFLDEYGKRLITLGHGAVVYDFDGQNVCLTNALTIEPYTENVRQLIFFPDGHLRYDWQFKGAILI